MLCICLVVINFRPFLLAGLGAARNNVDYTVRGTPLGTIDGKIKHHG